MGASGARSQLTSALKKINYRSGRKLRHKCTHKKKNKIKREREREEEKRYFYAVKEV